VHFGIAIAWREADWVTDARNHGPGFVGVLQLWPAESIGAALEESYGIQRERLTDLLQKRRQRP
jgi:hypothetical protein